MPSMLHEALLLLFRNRPTLAPELLRDVLGVDVPTFTEARVESAELTEVVPTEYRADLVVLLLKGKPIFAIVVEVQLGRDESKRMTWPLYLASLRSRLGCPTALLVVTPDAAIARWCAEPIEMGHPTWVLRPLVLGPDAVPVISEESQAKADPELGVLSMMAHSSSQDAVQRALTLLGVVRGLDEERARLYADLVMMVLPDAARLALEKLMQSGNYQYQSDFAKKYYGQGKAEGKAEGRQEEAAKMVLAVLEARGVKVDEANKKKVETCTDLSQLEIWAKRAVSATSLEEVFSNTPLPLPSVAGPKRPTKLKKSPKRSK